MRGVLLKKNRVDARRGRDEGAFYEPPGPIGITGWGRATVNWLMPGRGQTSDRSYSWSLACDNDTTYRRNIKDVTRDESSSLLRFRVTISGDRRG